MADHKPKSNDFSVCKSFLLFFETVYPRPDRLPETSHRHKTVSESRANPLSKRNTTSNNDILSKKFADPEFKHPDDPPKMEKEAT